jgi:hypothetical protein
MKTFFQAQATRTLIMFTMLLSTVASIAQTSGDYRSVTAGSTLNWNNLSSWQRFNGTSWVTPTSGQGYPGQFSGTGAVLIQNSSTATVYLNVSPANPIASLQIGTAGGASSGDISNSGGNFTLSVTGDIDIQDGSFNIGSIFSGTYTYNLYVGGDISVSSGSSLGFIAGGNETGNIILNGSGQTISGTGTISADNWTLSNNGVVNLNSNIGAGNLSVGSNSTLLPDAAVQINAGGATGTLSGSGTVFCTRISSTPTLANQLKFSTFTLTGIAVNYSGLGAQTIAGYSMESLTLSGSGTKTCSAGFTVSNGLTIESGTTLDPSSFTSTVGGGLNVNGTLDFTNTSGLIRTATSGATMITMGTNGLIRTSDDSGFGPGTGASLQTQSSGTWNLGNTSTAGTIEYYRNSGSAQTVTDRDYNNLIITGTNATFVKTWSPATSRTINGDITIQGTFTTTGSQTINLKGNWIKTTGTYTANNVTVNMNGSAQSISGNSSTSFYNLTINQSPASTVSNAAGQNAFAVTNALTVTQGNLILQATDANYNFNNVVVSTNGTLTHSVEWNTTNKNIAISGNLDVTGIWNPTVRSHVSMTGTGSKSIRTGSNPSSRLSILTFAGNGTFTQNGNLVCDQEVWGFFGVSGGTFNTGTNTFSCLAFLNNLGTVNFNAGSTVNITNEFQVGYSTNAGTVNIGTGAVLTAGDLLINSNGSLVCSGSPTINVTGNWTRNGSFTAANSTVNFTNTSGAQSFAGSVAAQSFYNLGITKANQQLNLGGSLTSLTITNNLTLTSGMINAGSIPVIVSNSAAAAVNSTGGYVSGKLQRTVTTGNGYLFAVGTASGYTPAIYNFSSVTGSGSVTIQSKDGAGTLYPATLHATKKLARNWSVTKAGITAYNASANFSYSNSDLAGSATDLNLHAYIASPALAYPVITTASHSFSLTGITSDGEIGAGECSGSLAGSFTKTKASSCHGGSDGTITVSATGGTSPYSFSWTGPSGYTASTAAISALGTGDYTVIIKDLTGCSYSIPNITILQALTPALTNNMTLSSLCVGNGSLTLYATLGVPPYTYSLNGTTYQASNVFTNLAGGNYTGFVKDSRGCVGTKPMTVGTWNQLSVTSSSAASSACVNNGKLVLSPSGGKSPYTYSKNGTTYQSSNTFLNLAPGNYTCYVKDSKGCIITKSCNVPLVPGMTVHAFATSAGACANNGSFTLSVTGGRAPYSYSINNVTYVTTNSFTGLAGNQTYTGWVKDADGCKVNVTVTVPKRAAVAATIVTINTGTCSNSGMIKVTATGGVQPYTYSLNNVTYQSSPNFPGQAAGNYTVWVKDASGCITSVNATVGTGSALIANAVSTPSASCANTGIIKINPAGGDGPFSYSLDNITYQASQTFANLAAGNYTAWAKSVSGCKSSVSVTVTQYETVTASARFTNSSACGSDGTIQATALTGKAPFTYSIDGINFQSSHVFMGLSAGNYMLTVKDATGCSAIVNVIIGTDSFTATSLTGPANSCAASNGFVKLLPSGGTSPYTYSIDGVNFQQSPMFNGLPAGSYMGYIKDSKGCIASASAMVGPNTCNSRVKVSTTEKTKVEAYQTGKVYPNPSVGSFNIELNPLGTTLIRVTDITGKLVAEKQVSGKGIVQIGGDWKPGIYFIQLDLAGKKSTLRLIKQ